MANKCVHIIERAHTYVQPVNIKVAQIPRDNPAHLKADLSRWEDRATFRPFLSTRAGQQTNDREDDHDTNNCKVEALQKSHCNENKVVCFPIMLS